MATDWFVYLLQCSDGSLYCGITNDVNKRIDQHNSGRGAKYTRSRLPVSLAYVEMVENKSSALRQEAKIKKMTRKDKETLAQTWRNAGMRKVIIASADDWQTLYVDGKKRLEGHSLRLDEVLQELDVDVIWAEIDQEWSEENAMPDDFKKIPSKKICGIEGMEGEMSKVP